MSALETQPPIAQGMVVGGSEQKAGTSHRAAYVAGLVPLILLVHGALGRDEYTLSARVCAGLIACIATFAVVCAKRFALPILGIHLMRFYVLMAAPVFSEPRLMSHRGPIRISQESYERALLAELAFTLVLVFMWWATQPVGTRVALWAERRLPWLSDSAAVVPSQQGGTVVRSLAATSMLLYAAIVLAPSAIPEPLWLLVSLVTQPSVPLVLLLWEASRSPRTGWWLFGSCAVYQTFVGIASGYLGEVLTPAITVTVLLWMYRGRLPWTLLVVGALVFSVLNPIKHVYRRLSWNTDHNPTLIERVENWGTAFRTVYLDGATSFDLDSGVDNVATRLSALPQVAHIFDTVPRHIPHTGPEPWLMLPLFYVPTALWPERPSYRWFYNKEYALVFELQPPQLVRTSTLNLPCVGDGYWRLGWIGVLIEALIMGAVLGGLQGIASLGSRSAVLVVMTYVGTLRPEAHVMSNISTLPQFLIFAVILLVCVNAPQILTSTRRSA